jgi:hypothetical protein
VGHAAGLEKGGEKRELKKDIRAEKTAPPVHGRRVGEREGGQVGRKATYHILLMDLIAAVENNVQKLGGAHHLPDIVGGKVPGQDREVSTDTKEGRKGRKTRMRYIPR